MIELMVEGHRFDAMVLIESGDKARYSSYHDLWRPDARWKCDTPTSGNTSGIYTEPLGLALPGSGTMPAGSNYQLRAAKYMGMRIMDLLAQDLSARCGSGRRRLIPRQPSGEKGLAKKV
jgi:dihydroxyacid dehydratase/phosphogluconate dehydratase